MAAKKEKPPRPIAPLLHEDGVHRCPWSGADPLYVAYHDEEWGVPEYDDQAMFEKLVLDGFQAGLSWITILRKRPAFRNAFDGFDPEKIVRWSDKKKEALMQDAGIVRNRAKIEATVALARIYARPRGQGRLRAPFVELRRRTTDPERAPHRCADMPAESDVSAAPSPRTCARAAAISSGRRSSTPSCRRPAWSTIISSIAAVTRPARRWRANSAHERCSRRRAWQRMLSGRRLDLIDPSPLDVEIADIAHGLARVARWNGQTQGAEIFSVAQHSLLVEALFAAGDARLRARRGSAALLHDAPEYVIGDMISPFKAAIGGEYKRVEARLLAAILIRFGLPPNARRTISTLIKIADRASAYFEATRACRLLDRGGAQAVRRAELPLRGIRRAILSRCGPPMSKRGFLARFAELDADAPRMETRL